MRVGLVCPYDISRRGGVQQLCLDLAERLLLDHCEVVLVAPGQADLPNFHSVGSTIAVRSNRSAVPLAPNPAAIAATRNALADVDVIHVHEPFIPWVGWAGISMNRPIVATFHADPAAWTRRLYRVVAGPLSGVMRRATLTSVSPVAASAIPPSWGNVQIVPNAINVADYRSQVPRKPHQVAFLGRDDPRKGLDVLLEAWPEIRSNHAEAELVVMGTRRDDALGGVTYLGSVDDATKRAVLAQSGLFVAPNLGGESFGIVLLEAMAAGCSVVASRLPAFTAVIERAGTLVNPGDSGAIAESVGRLLENPDEAAEMGRRGAERASHFDWSVVARQYRQLYDSAMKDWSTR